MNVHALLLQIHMQNDGWNIRKQQFPTASFLDHENVVRAGFKYLANLPDQVILFEHL